MVMSGSQAGGSIVSTGEGPVGPELPRGPGPMGGATPASCQHRSWEAASCPTPTGRAPLVLLVTPTGATSGRVPPRDCHQACHCARPASGGL